MTLAAARQPGAFGRRLRAAVAAHGPLCVGIDPSRELLEAWGLDDDASGVEAFARRCIETVRGAVPAVKLNAAFFERHGPDGMAVLARALRDARQAGLIAIADAKRSDIGNTMVQYAQAWLSEAGPFGSDALTVVPYFGIEAFDPLVELAEANGRGIFVVVRSSNPGGRLVQTSVVEVSRDAQHTDPGSTSLEELLLDELSRRSNALGAVIGVLAGGHPLRLPSDGFYLAPGVGAQGATPGDLARAFADAPSNAVLVNLSRSLLRAGPDPGALRAALQRAHDEIAPALR